MITEHREPNDDEDGDVNEYASSIYSFEKKNQTCTLVWLFTIKIHKFVKDE